MNQNLRNEILKSVSNGKKAIDLIPDIATIPEFQKILHHEFINEIEEMIHDGEIIEIEYELPSMEYRTKSIYFPSGTTIRIRDFTKKG